MMARPTKSVDTMSKHLTNEEKQARKEQEEKLKGNSNKVKPPSYLSEQQKKIFRTIVNELKASGILCNLDVYVLTTTSFAIDRLQSIETLINENINNIYNKDLMASKDKYTKDLWRGCNELSLSPQSRSKLGNLNILAKEKAEDPLLKVLSGGD
jgi:P27 family predicted phage terminase small subunit